ncbi:MAG: DUF779 domain-containing protein [Leptolyngbya sp.]|nr:DUF779 domain-containing protein [Leptolyngbya sp.]
MRTPMARYGPLMFHQPGGGCDGSAPKYYPLGGFLVGAQGVLLGAVAGCLAFIAAQQDTC